MSRAANWNASDFVGQSVDRLSLEQREDLAGKYIAREVYTPKTLPLQRIEAIGDTVEQCVQMLQQRGLDVMKFEFVRLNPPY